MISQPRPASGRGFHSTEVDGCPSQLGYLASGFGELPEPFGAELTPFKIAMVVLVDLLLVIWLAAPFINRSRRATHDYAAEGMVVASHA